MIYDLHERISTLQSEGVRDRLSEAGATLPHVGVVALNGIPFVGTPVTYFGQPVVAEDIEQQLRLALGFGGSLTYLNPNNLSLPRLAEHALQSDHDWALHAVHVTLCFAGCPTFVEMSFGRDSRFHLSWVEPRTPTDWNRSRVFTASASLKHWKKYLRNRDSGDFAQTQRRWLKEAYRVLSPLFPAYFA